MGVSQGQGAMKMTVTNKGRELADKLGRYTGWTFGISETCSLICRHATTYNRIQELWCNEAMSDKATARLEAKEARLEARIDSLVRDLPDGEVHVMGSDELVRMSPKARFDGDPRGYTVRIVFDEHHEVGVA
jgi:hypothetical protein